MSSQSILTTATPNTGLIDVSELEAEIVIDVRNYVGWGFDVNIESLDASGSLYIYTQYTDFDSSLYLSDEDIVALVNAGTFVDGSKKLIVDSNNLITRSYVLIKWVGSAVGTGFLEVKGIGTLRG